LIKSVLISIILITDSFVVQVLTPTSYLNHFVPIHQVGLYGEEGGEEEAEGIESEEVEVEDGDDEVCR
jgi:hypothetical protein